MDREQEKGKVSGILDAYSNDKTLLSVIDAHTAKVY